MKKRLLTLLLTAGLLVTSVPTMGIAAEPAADGASEQRKLVASYDMSHAGGKLTDLSGFGNDAEVVGFADGDFGTESEDKVLNFTGDKNKYVKLPSGLVEKESFAIEAKFKTSKVENSWLWCFGTKVENTGRNYVFVSPAFSGNVIRAGIKDGSTESLFDGAGSITANEYNTILMEFDQGQMSLTVNGEKKSTMSTGYSIQEILANGSEADFSGYIGKSLYSADPAFTGTLTQFNVYAAVRDTSDAGLLKEDLDAVSVPNMTSTDLTLPEKGSLNGSTIVWKSSNKAVLAEDGTVTLPQENTTVTLTAEGSYKSAAAQRTYKVEVIGVSGLLEHNLLIPYTLTQEDQLPETVSGADITWKSSNTKIITNDGKILAPETGISEEVKLTANIELNGKATERTYAVQVLGKDSKVLLGYTRNGSVNGGLRVGNSLHLAYSEDGTSFEALNTNYGVLFAEADYSQSTAGSTRTIKDPYVFRMKEGGFGVIATRAYTDGKSDTPGQVLYFTSEDLIQYKEEGLREIQKDQNLNNLSCEYDGAADNYRIGWNSDEGIRYYCTTEDFKTFSEPQAGISFEVKNVDSTSISNAIPENIIYVTEEEGLTVKNRLCRLTNTSVEDAKIQVKVGEEIDFKDVRVKANYNDGSSHDKRVAWNQEQIDAIDTGRPGSYTVEGTVVQEVYPFPMMRSRADPNIIYYKGKYYFIATDDKNALQYNIYIRGADTVAGLADSRLADGSDKVDVNDHLLWDGESSQIKDAQGNWIENPHQGIHWAPELHVINDQLYCFFSMRPHNNVGGRYLPQSYVAKLKEDGDPLKAQDWEEPVRVQKKDGSPLIHENDGISLDMTYFEVDGVSYACWSQRLFANGEHPGLMVAKIDKNEPWKLLNEPRRLSQDTFSWERDGCNEGAYVTVNNGTVYMVFSANGVGPQYATGMMTAKVGDDLSDPSVWTKSNYPWMNNESFPGQSGLGHNSFFTDEYGDLYNIYHANGSNDRSSTIVPLRFRADGSPVLDIRPEEDLNPAYKSVKAVVTVSDGSEPENPPVDTIFEDISGDEWYVDYVQYVYDNGIMTGMTDTIFGSNAALERSHFATMLYRLEGKPEVEYKDSFKDVPRAQFYTDAVMWASSEEVGVISGYEDGRFGPDDQITREQMAVMLYRYAEYKGYDVEVKADLSKYEDASKVSPFAEKAMQWAVGAKLIKGEGDGEKLNPQGSTSRAVCATIMQRFMEELKK